MAKDFSNNYYLGIYFDNPSKTDIKSESRSTIGILLKGEDDMTTASNFIKENPEWNIITLS